jgi:multicomponent Na+:H+ antiporter subunit B
MSRRAQVALFLAGAVGLALLLAWGLGGLPPFGEYRGPYGDVLNRVVVSERHVSEVVTAVVFDYRGFDTLGEEFILFASVVGVALLLRVGREEEERQPGREAAHGEAPTTDAIRVAGLGMVGPTVLLGLAIAAHGHVTPGGGFQGGVILASGSLLVFLAGTYLTFRRVNPEGLIDLAEGTGAGGFASVGLLGLVVGAAYLENVLPLGISGDLLSGGTIPLANMAVALAVAAGFVLILYEFLEQTLVVRVRSRR